MMHHRIDGLPPGLDPDKPHHVQYSHTEKYGKETVLVYKYVAPEPEDEPVRHETTLSKYPHQGRIERDSIREAADMAALHQQVTYLSRDGLPGAAIVPESMVDYAIRHGWGR